MGTHWSLFEDWCSATDRRALPASVDTIGAFFDQVPASASTLRGRLRAIRRAHQAAGVRLEVGEEPVPSAWRSGRDWLTYDEALARCESDGWPAAFRGRRDAFILTVVERTRLPRRRIVGLSAEDIEWDKPPTLAEPLRVLGVPIFPTSTDPALCPACAITRWIRLVSLYNRWSASAVKERLYQAPTHPDEHDCAKPPPRRWREVWDFLPAIDQHGWASRWRSMGPRALSAVLAERLARPGERRVVAAAVSEPRPEWDTGDDSPERVSAAQAERERLRGVSESELWSLLDERIAATEDANARVNAFLADAEALVGRIGATQAEAGFGMSAPPEEESAAPESGG